MPQMSRIVWSIERGGLKPAADGGNLAEGARKRNGGACCIFKGKSERAAADAQRHWQGGLSARRRSICRPRPSTQLHARARDTRLSAECAGRMMDPSRTLVLATLWLPSRTAYSERGPIKPAEMLRGCPWAWFADIRDTRPGKEKLGYLGSWWCGGSVDSLMIAQQKRSWWLLGARSLCCLRRIGCGLTAGE